MKDLFRLFKQPGQEEDFDAIRISVASPEKNTVLVIRGSKKKPETINYRTFKPERDGLFLCKNYSVRSVTMSACAENTSVLSTVASYAKNAVWKSLKPRFAVSAWAISSWPVRLRTSGF